MTALKLRYKIASLKSKCDVTLFIWKWPEIESEQNEIEGLHTQS